MLLIGENGLSYRKGSRKLTKKLKRPLGRFNFLDCRKTIVYKCQSFVFPIAAYLSPSDEGDGGRQQDRKSGKIKNCPSVTCGNSFLERVS